MDQVIAKLDRIRVRSRVMFMVHRLCVSGAVLITCLFIAVLADYWLRLPPTVRVVQLLVGVMGVVHAARVYVQPAVMFRPTRIDIALRLERLVPSLSGELASGVELAAEKATSDPGPLRGALIDRAVAEAAHRARCEDLGACFNHKPVARSISAFLFATIAAIFLILLAPEMAAIGCTRILLPLADVHWPKRTNIISLMERDTHPLGTVLSLRAAVTKPTPAPSDMEVTAHYCLITDGIAGPREQVILTDQERSIIGADGQTTGQLFERLIEPDANRIELWFETMDDRTDVQQITLVERPGVESATVRIGPPAYVADLVDAAELDLGSGTDERAFGTTVLAGSSATLDLALSTSLLVPEAGAERDEWLAHTFTWDAPTSFCFIARDDVWSLQWSLTQSAHLTLHLEDKHGFTAGDDIAYHIGVVEDGAPRVMLSAPMLDTTVLPTALIDVEARAEDDVALRMVGIRSHVGESEEMIAEIQTTARETSVAAVLDLETRNVQVGDVVELVAWAVDAYADAGLGRDAVMSQPRRLVIISRGDLVSELRSELTSLREQLIRIDGRQERLIRTSEQSAERTERRGQSEIGRSITQQAETVERLQDRAAMNRLRDAAMDDLLGEAANRLNEATALSSAASETLARRQQAHQQQQAVRSTLAELIELLDLGEDTWVMRRRLEEILRAQESLRASLSNLAGADVGRSIDQVSLERRAELQRLADAQQRLADRLAASVDEMHQRAEQLDEVDPAGAAGLTRAAETASVDHTSDTMQHAAQHARRNQVSSGLTDQHDAVESLERMLDELEQGERGRAEALRRRLISIIESLQLLVRDQQAQIVTARSVMREHADPTVGELESLSAGMIALNRNTLSALAQITEAGRDAAPIAQAVDDAADSQDTAIVSLRAMPSDVVSAIESEQESLQLLEHALRLAEEKEQELAGEQATAKRREIVAAYREALEAQMAIRAEAKPFADRVGLNRRERQTLRMLGGRQDSLRAEVAEIASSTAELADAIVFDFSHREIDILAERSATSLRDASVDVFVISDQKRVESLIAGMIGALDEPSNRPEFDEQAAGNGAGSGAGGGGGARPSVVPDTAQIRLLLGIQDAIYHATLRLDELREQGRAIPDERIEQLGASQMELHEMAERILETMHPAPPKSEPEVMP